MSGADKPFDADTLVKEKAAQQCSLHTVLDIGEPKFEDSCPVATETDRYALTALEPLKLRSAYVFGDRPTSLINALVRHGITVKAAQTLQTLRSKQASRGTNSGCIDL